MKSMKSMIMNIIMSVGAALLLRSQALSHQAETADPAILSRSSKGVL
jgi:hypothetical protein